MSTQTTHWKSPKAKLRHDRQVAVFTEKRNAKLNRMVEHITAALGRSRNSGVVFGSSYDIILLIVALEIEHGPGAQSSAQRERSRQAFLRGEADPRSGYSKHTQGDNQKLVRDAVNLAIERGEIKRHDEPDGTIVAIYLPAAEKTQPRWTAFLKEAGKVHDYVPSLREIADYLRIKDLLEDEDSDSSVRLSGKHQALLIRWGEQFPS